MFQVRHTALAVALVLAGCMGGVGTAEAPAPGDLEWVDGPTAGVTSLVLRPGVLEADDADIPHRPVVALGAYLGRLETEAGPRRHLALLVQLEGQGTALDLDFAQGMVVELDGVPYHAPLSLTGESVFMDQTPRGRRVTLSFPVDRFDLERVLASDEVRIRVAGSCFFRLAEEDQHRIRRFVDRLPPTGIVSRSALAQAE
jgi:hypothetical protein